MQVYMYCYQYTLFCATASQHNKEIGLYYYYCYYYYYYYYYTPLTALLFLMQ